MRLLKPATRRRKLQASVAQMTQSATAEDHSQIAIEVDQLKELAKSGSCIAHCERSVEERGESRGTVEGQGS